MNMKQCPFCAYDGTRIELATALSGSHYEYQETCLNCGARGPGESSKEQAAESWDMRRNVHQSVKVDADTHEDLRNATPEQLLEATVWFYRETVESPAAGDRMILFLRLGFQLARPGGWERVAPMWLRESRKIAALDG